MRSIKLLALLGVLVGLIVAVALATPLLRRMQIEREWMDLQDACDAGHAVSCMLLATRVTPPCARDRDALACYHLARVLDRGASHLRDSKRIAGYYQLACQAGVRRACGRP